MKWFGRKPKKKHKPKKNPGPPPPKQKPKSAPKPQNKPAPQAPKGPWKPPFPTAPAGDPFPPLQVPPLGTEETIPLLPPPTAQRTKPTMSTPRTAYYKPQEEKKAFLKTFRKLTGRYSSWEVWSDFIVMVACTISNSFDKAQEDVRAKRYLQVASKYTTQELDLFPDLFAHLVEGLEKNQDQDFLGDIYTELGLNSKERRQIFTPYHVSDLMSQITLGDLVKDVEEKGVVTIHDPCCGAGSTLIAAANTAKDVLSKAGYNYQNHILITGQDIDETVLLMCYIQISLLGVAGYFKVGDSIMHPMSPSDTLENYWYTPMFFFPVWQLRKIFRAVQALTAGEENDKV